MKIYAIVDEDGEFRGFKTEEFFPPTPVYVLDETGEPVIDEETGQRVIDHHERDPAIPETAIEISETVHQDFLANQGRRQWDAHAQTFVPIVPLEPSFADSRAARFAALAAKRYAVEVGGTLFNGTPIRTDRETSAIMTAAIVLARDDPNFTVPNWKVADGVFLTLDATTLLAISAAMRAHVQACFDREAALSVDLLAAETVQELEAVDLDGGWPANPDL